MNDNDSVGKVKTTKTVFRIIEYLSEHNGARVTEVATALGIAKSTAHRHLVTLEAEEYVVKQGDQYRLSFRFLNLGIQARNRRRAFELVEKKVRDIGRKTGERVQFVLEEHGYAVFIFRESGENAVMTNSEVGKYIPIHASSAGKTILAHTPTEKVDRIIDERGLDKLTEFTITDRDSLYADLDRTRDRGYGINDQENIMGLRAIGVPVMDRNGEILGALSVSGPTNRMKDDWLDTELKNLLLGTANELELNIKHL